VAAGKHVLSTLVEAYWLALDRGQPEDAWASCLCSPPPTTSSQRRHHARQEVREQPGTVCDTASPLVGMSCTIVGDPAALDETLNLTRVAKAVAAACSSTRAAAAAAAAAAPAAAAAVAAAAEAAAGAVNCFRCDTRGRWAGAAARSHDGIESSHLADALARVLEGLVHFQRRPDSHRADHVVRILHSERRTWVGPPKQTSSSRRSKLCIMFVHGVGLLTGPAAGVVGGIASGIAPALLVIVFCRVTTHEPPTNFVVLEYIRVLKYCNTRVPSSTRVLQFTANVKPVKQHESCARKSPVLWKYISLSGSVDKYTSSYNAQM